MVCMYSANCYVTRIGGNEVMEVSADYPNIIINNKTGKVVVATIYKIGHTA